MWMILLTEGLMPLSGCLPVVGRDGVPKRMRIGGLHAEREEARAVAPASC